MKKENFKKSDFTLDTEKECKSKKDILILGIESSCDDTSVAIVKNGREVLSNAISSQIDIHTIYGGVVPEIASRNHTKNIQFVLEKALKDANCTLNDISAIAVTYGAGLLGALIVGVSFAKALAYATKKPLFAVNHIEGHISANYIQHKDLKPPFVCLVVSGGHTALFEMKSHTEKKLIATTTDDAIGEAFDKVSRECGLGYPGGPAIQKCALNGQNCIEFVRHNTNKTSKGFSYSGLKTAVINYLHNKKQKNEDVSIPDVCASFQSQAVEQLVKIAMDELKKTGHKKLVLAGGVSANALLRQRFTEECEKIGVKLYYPELKLCTDNAAMIASQAYFNYISGAVPADLTLAPKSTVEL